MFTGIVQKTGRIVELQRQGRAGKLTLECEPWSTPLELGESIAVNGCCLTVARIDGRRFGFDVLEETFARTSIGGRTLGQRLNLERALTVGAAIGGHFVTGHVDGTGKVHDVRQIGRDWVYAIACAPDLLLGMVPKGSIAIDGISLTIVELTTAWFSVHIIPHTHDVTSISELKTGDPVNLETDMIGKYVQRILEGRKGSEGLTWDKLRAAGWNA